MGVVARTIISFVVVATAAGAAVSTTAWLRGQREIDHGIGTRLSQLKSDLNSRIDAEATRATSLAHDGGGISLGPARHGDLRPSGFAD